MSFQPAQASMSTGGDASLGTAATGTTSSVADSTEYVTLVSNDGFEFVIPREAACVSGTIRRMLENGSHFQEAVTGRIHFEDFSGVVLEKVCEYFLYNDRNKGQMNVPDMEIPSELCLELLMAADYLDA